MAEKRRYGIGTQVFAEFIHGNGVYVDKTAYVYKMTHAQGKYFFLSRPRRFGKYPVIRIDLSSGKYYQIERLHGTIGGILRRLDNEVFQGFADSLYQYYAEDYIGSRDQMNNAFWDLRQKKTTFEQFLESVRLWYAGIPYSITCKNQNEQFYQSLFYSLMAAIGGDVHAEEQTADGRMDISLKLQDAIYILEFKLDQSADEALRQIDEKQYAAPFAHDPLPLFKIGINFSTQTRRIEGWKMAR